MAGSKQFLKNSNVKLNYGPFESYLFTKVTGKALSLRNAILRSCVVIFCTGNLRSRRMDSANCMDKESSNIETKTKHLAKPARLTILEEGAFFYGLHSEHVEQDGDIPQKIQWTFQ
jgi:hypothetical protein